MDKNIKRKYSLSDYDPGWVAQFNLIKDFLAKIFKEKALEIEHMGSTSVPGMKAKPVIDVLVVVEKMEPFEEQKTAMEREGYEWGENYIAPNTIIFFKLGPDSEKTENIHVCERGSAKARQFILMRDYLRAHPEKAKAYSDLKEKNALLYPDDYPAYRSAKASFLDQLEADARKWSN